MTIERKEKYLISKTFLPKEIKKILIKKGVLSIEQLCGYTEKHLRRITGLNKRTIKKIQKYLANDGRRLFELTPNPYFFQIVNLYRRGETLQDIGLEFNLTRERIRQIIQNNIDDEELSVLKKEHCVNKENYPAEARKNLIIYLKNIAKKFYLITDFIKDTKIPLNIVHIYLPEIIELFNRKRGGYRKTVIESFRFSCAECGLSQTESIIKYDKDLCVYHKNRDKRDVSPRNLVPLCSECLLKEARRNKKLNGIKKKIALLTE